MVKLKIKDDEGQTTSVSLTRDEYTVGRKEGNTIRLTAENVSRTHARLLKKGKEVHIEDLSKYGTRVNGERIKTSRRLTDGDEVVIGDYALSLEGSQPLAEAPPAPTDDTSSDDALDKEPKPREATGVGLPTPLEKAAKAQIAAAKASVSDKTSAGESKEEKHGRGKGKKRIEAAHPMLVAVNSQLAGTTYPITGETMILGRTGENDLQVEHHSISRNHAKIVMKDGRITMVDLASKNGIRVNGEYWEESVLKSGDVIELGKVSFRFVEEGEDFIFRPEDWAGGVPAGAEAAEEPEKKGGLKPWVLIALVLLVGGLVAVLVLANQEPEVNNVPPTTAPPIADTKTPPPETKAPETKPPTPDSPNKADLIKDALEKARAAVGAEKWDDADKQVQAVIALDKGNAEGKQLQAKIASERKAAAGYKAAQDAQAKSDLPAAWQALESLKDLPQDSVYAPRLKELRDVVGPAIANTKIDEAKAALGRKRYSEAIKLADEALAIMPDNKEASDVKARARRLRDAARTTRRPPTTKAPTTKPPETKPAATGKSGKDLYREARKIHNSDPSGALKLYQQAAKKGYTNAYKQIGSVQIQLGNTAAAIKAYKRYLSLNPAARDAATVRDIIVRMGGTP